MPPHVCLSFLSSIKSRDHHSEKEGPLNPQQVLERLIIQLSFLMTGYHRDCLDGVMQTMRSYAEETDASRRTKQLEGWGLGTLTVLGAICQVLALPSFTDAQHWGKILESGAHLTEGLQQVTRVLAEKELLPHQQQQLFLQTALEAGKKSAEEASQESKNLLQNFLLRIFEIDAKSKTFR